MKKQILTLGFLALFMIGCGEEAPEPIPAPSSGSVNVPTQSGNFSIDLAPSNTLILAQKLVARPGGPGQIAVLTAINETEFDTNRVAQGYVFVGRVLASPTQGSYRFYSWFENGIKHYYIGVPSTNGVPESFFGFQSRHNGSLGLLCEFPFGFAMCGLFQNQNGRAIGYIYYATQEDIDLNRNL